MIYHLKNNDQLNTVVNSVSFMILKIDVDVHRGGSAFFFLGVFYFNANKPHLVFFGRIPVILESRMSSHVTRGRGGGRGCEGCTPPAPSPRSAHAHMYKTFSQCEHHFRYHKFWGPLHLVTLHVRSVRTVQPTEL